MTETSSTSENRRLWDRERLVSLFRASDDVKQYLLPDQAGLLLYSEGLSSLKSMNEVLGVDWEKRVAHEAKSWRDEGCLPFQVSPVSSWADTAQLSALLFAGWGLLYLEATGLLYGVNCSQRPEREPDASTTEPTNYGPKDAFVESVQVNVALVRKRLRTHLLACEMFTVGSRSQTNIALLYMTDLLDPDTLRHIRDRLSAIKPEIVFTNEQLKNMLLRPGLAFFPLMYNTSRPDMVVESLASGRFVLLTDGLPNALIAPVQISFLLASPEDAHLPAPVLIIGKAMRLAGLLIALLLPGFWTALTTYHQDQIPLALLATITMANMGTPISGPLEMLLMLVMFQLFVEAGARLPSTFGPSISVVGGLIIGDAIIRAGLSSPASLVVAAATMTSQFVLMGGMFGLAVTMLRFYIYLLAAFFGLFGFFTGVITILIYMANLRSFGVPYLIPVSPFRLSALRFILIRFPRGDKRRRPTFLGDKVLSSSDGVKREDKP
ncbi:GerA spore germination protein [Paenibacillus sp. UNCCL117]|uniref:spore germination protein n=1 Tax=unclassified Paenibacillus TaxID=185978 RepID=UPI000884DDE4|nr:MULTISPECIES: spore germination protein [unclassified Paenibacillus]SDD25904.1 GerA spore germination protein [Paenibacillus sp. cl123]SFW41186.1 GerA spore germination protein [Paenibacillus sp. UNCCL117]